MYKGNLFDKYLSMYITLLLPMSITLSSTYPSLYVTNNGSLVGISISTPQKTQLEIMAQKCQDMRVTIDTLTNLLSEARNESAQADKVFKEKLEAAECLNVNLAEQLKKEQRKTSQIVSNLLAIQSQLQVSLITATNTIDSAVPDV